MRERMNADSRAESPRNRAIQNGHPHRHLKRTWARHLTGSVFLAARHRTLKNWVERSYHPLYDWEAIENFLINHPPDEWDLYYCPNAFRKPKRLKKYALQTPWAWCDIDDADPRKFQPPPSILTSTSPGRHQGLWELTTAIPPDKAEALSKGLAYLYGGDRNGWSITKMLRLPGTINHKPQYDAPLVAVVKDTGKRHLPWDERAYHGATPPLNIDANPQQHEWQEVVLRYRRKVRGQLYHLMTDTWMISKDRSRCVFMIVAALHEAGATPDEIAAVVWRSPYFISKYGQSRVRLNAELGRILAKLRGGQ